MAYRLVHVAGLLTLCTASTTSAYELITHLTISEAAVDVSVLVKDPSILKDLGLDNAVAPNALPDGDRRRSVRQIIGVGAQREDTLTGTRPIHHFFDPTRAGDTNNGALRLPVPVTPTYSSPTWALADRGPVNGQEHSLRNARSYLLNALTSGTKSEREAAFTKKFQTLGMVIHHLQDMAQPQHVRNDLHCKEPVCRPFFHNPSAYEDYTEQRFSGRVGSIPTMTGYPSVYTGANATTISTPRALWYTGDGKGIAEFTNRNFVSAGTNFRYEGKALPDAFYGYPSPVPTSNSVTIAEAYAARQDGQTLPPQLAEFCGPSTTCVIEFYATSGTDALTGAPVNNPRASSLSIFDWDLKGRPVSLTTGDGSRTFSTQRLFSLNSFNFDAATDILLMRAVGYSAGMIDYFFRGKLDFKKDEKDQTKFKIVNLGSEAMSGRFALYYDAKDGNRYPVEIDPTDGNRDPDDPKAWRFAIPPLNPAAPDSNQSAPILFIAPANDGSQLAPKAVDEYMLVFNGDMGEEKEDKATGVKGAVVAKLISAVSDGALYLLGADASNQRVLLRADTTGTRVVGANEFHPMRDVTIAPWPSLTRVHYHKQVAFTQSASGYSYETLAATVGMYSYGVVAPRQYAYPTSWVKLSATGAFGRMQGAAWVARSADPLIGEFVFFPVIPSTPGAAGSLRFERSFRNAAGEVQKVGGSIPMPTIGGLSQIGTFLSQNRVFISSDGLTVSGFRLYNDPVDTREFPFHSDGTYSVTTDSFDLKITLAETPTRSFVKIGEQSSFRSVWVYRNTGDETTPRGSRSVPMGCDSPPRSVYTYKWDYLGSIIGDSESSSFIEYFNGALRSARYTGKGSDLISIQSNREAGGYTSPPDSPFYPCLWVYDYRKGETVDKGQDTEKVVLSNGTFTSVYSGKNRRYPYPIGFAPPVDSQWDYSYEGPAPAPPFVYTPTLPALQPVSSAHRPEWMITDRVEDAVYVVATNGGPSVTKFRSFDITGKEYVAEASPIREVFFATTDLSVVVHEPIRGPKVIIPPNVLRLMAAIWM